MVAWLTVIVLIVIGLSLINIEVIFIPGTTIVGLFGVIIAAGGIFFSFLYFGQSTGFTVLTVSLVVTLGSLIYFFKNNSWKSMSLHDTMKGKVNEGLTGTLKVGEEGITISTLRPSGKAEFFGKQYEVYTHEGYINAGEKVTILKIESNKILVEPIKS